MQTLYSDEVTVELIVTTHAATEVWQFKASLRQFNKENEDIQQPQNWREDEDFREGNMTSNTVNDGTVQ